MREETKLKYNDEYFFNNGYWRHSTDVNSSYRYEIVVYSQKFRNLVDTCLKLKGNGIITPELIATVIESGGGKRKSYYKKLTKEERDRRTAERHRIKEEKEKAIRNANRQSK